MEIMISFRNVDLESVAPVKIEDIRVSPVIRNPVTRERPIFGGADFVRVKDSMRTVGITFSILEQNMDARQRMLDAVSDWAISDKPEPLALPYRMGRLLDVICTTLPEPSARQWWESRLNIVFTAYDPYFYDPKEKSVECGNEFIVTGSAPPIMWIERNLSSQATNQSYSDGTDTMTFDTIPAGSMIIDLNQQTAAVNGTSIMEHYSFASRFILPKTGRQIITGTGTVKWKERWKS